MADKDKKIDPYDVEALEKSLNDSATRVSTIWVSYLIFGLYLVVAGGAVTHRQLFLQDPIELPVLNIELPIRGFFVLAPALFLFFHFYVLMQVVLLARTASAYNDAIEAQGLIRSAEARVRQRLINTLFAQIFAGSSREREGTLGVSMRAIAWLTLAIAPALVLLFLNFQFLPYHGVFGTWVQRLLVLLDVGIVLIYWPAALDGRREITWRSLYRDKYMAAPLLGSVLVMWALFSFPGEFHGTWTRYAAEDPQYLSVERNECARPSYIQWALPKDFDRLSLRREDFVDDERLSKIEAAGRLKGQSPFLTERAVKSFRGRDFRCADLSSTDLRRSDFQEADMTGALLSGAELDGANLSQAQLRGADLSLAKLGDASFVLAQMQGATLSGAEAQRVYFYGTSLKGADFSFAKLQGAKFGGARAQGANFERASMQAADLGIDMMSDGVELHGATFNNAQLQGSRFRAAKLQAADMTEADLRGADFSGTQSQGAVFERSKLEFADLSNAALWNAIVTSCDDTRVNTPKFGPSVGEVMKGEGENVAFEAIPFSAKAIDDLIEDATDGAPRSAAAAITKAIRDRLRADGDQVTLNRMIWQACAAKIPNDDTYNEKRAAFLAELVCKAGPERRSITNGVFENWIEIEFLEEKFAAAVARRLLVADGPSCPIRDQFTRARLEKLEELAGLQSK